MPGEHATETLLHGYAYIKPCTYRSLHAIQSPIFLVIQMINMRQGKGLLETPIEELLEKIDEDV